MGCSDSFTVTWTKFSLPLFISVMLPVDTQVGQGTNGSGEANTSIYFSVSWVTTGMVSVPLLPHLLPLLLLLSPKHSSPQWAWVGGAVAATGEISSTATASLPTKLTVSKLGQGWGVGSVLHTQQLSFTLKDVSVL